MSVLRKPKAQSNDYLRDPSMKSGKDAPDYKDYLQGAGRPGTYREMIGRVSQNTVLDKEIAEFRDHSEFKKPYLSDEYPEMEKFYAPPIAYSVNGPFPGVDPYNAPGTGPGQCWDVCWKNFSGMYTDNDCYVYIWANAHLSVKDISISMQYVDTYPGTFGSGGYSYKLYKSTAKHSDGEHVTWRVYQSVFDTCPSVDPIVAKSCKKTYSDYTSCAGCGAAVTWDYDTSAETIGDYSSAAVAVIAGTGPYTWSLTQAADEGSGFSLSATTTTSVSNTLLSGFTDGTAYVHVVDSCGTAVTGYVRGARGSWCMIDKCVSSGTAYVCYYYYDKYRLMLSWNCSDGTGDPYDGCGTTVYCTSPAITCPTGDWPCYFIPGYNCNDSQNPLNMAWYKWWLYEYKKQGMC